MSYNPATDYLSLIRINASPEQIIQMPGLDYVIAALARGGMITLSVGGTAPTSNQATTVWFQPSVPSYSSEGTMYLWNGSAYVAATPYLFMQMIAAVGQLPTASIVFGTGAPTSGVSQNGWFYVDTVTGNLYGPKAAGAWPALPAIFGVNATNAPNLILGATGGSAPGVGVGANGQFFLDTSTQNIWGPQAANVWPATPAAYGDGSPFAAGMITGISSGSPPLSTFGNNGNFFTDTSTGNVYGPKTAGAWPAVAAYTPATAGGGTNTLFGNAGGSAPSNSIGQNGQYYEDISTGNVYGPRAAGVWPATPVLAVTALGAVIVGATGGTAPGSGTGVNGQYFQDTNSGNIYGPKAAGAWPGTPAFTVAGVVDGNYLAGNSSGAAPSNSIGVNANYFLDISKGDIYGPKTGGVWPATPAFSPNGTPLGQPSAASGTSTTVVVNTGVTFASGPSFLVDLRRITAGSSAVNFQVSGDSGATWATLYTNTANYVSGFSMFVSALMDLSSNTARIGYLLETPGGQTPASTSVTVTVVTGNVQFRLQSAANISYQKFAVS